MAYDLETGRMYAMPESQIPRGHIANMAAAIDVADEKRSRGEDLSYHVPIHQLVLGETGYVAVRNAVEEEHIYGKRI